MLQSSSEEKASSCRYALCVGIGTYTNLVNHNLRYAVADSEAIAKRLVERGDFAATCLKEPTQTTKATLEKAVEDLLSAPERQAEDLIVLYFSCHGDVNKTENTFILLPSDATRQANGIFDQSTVIDISDLAKWFSMARTRNIVLLLETSSLITLRRWGIQTGKRWVSKRAKIPLNSCKCGERQVRLR